VQEYFIVDPEDDSVLAYYLQDGRYQEQYREKNIIRSKVLQTEFKW
jgi:Uma2 family endonuclease